MKNMADAFARIDDKIKFAYNECSLIENMIDLALTAHPLEDYHEDNGPCLWWKFPIEEPPFVGSPLDADWPGYHTHFTRLLVPSNPEE